MNRLGRVRFTVVSACVAAVLLFCRCTVEPIAGGGTEGGNAVAGVFINDDGTALAMAKVLLIPSDYNPGAAHQNNPIIASVTASDGSYAFHHVAQGSYSIEAADTASGKRSLIAGVDVSGVDFQLPVDTLRAPGAIRVFLPATADAATGYVYVPGTTAYARLTGAAGYAVVTALPAMQLPAICYATLTDTTPVVLRYNVQVASGDTAVVAASGWKYSRRLCLNTTATGAGVSRNVAGFPVLVRLTNNNFNFAQATIDGSDIRFARSDTLRLPYEIERWDPVTELAEVWVKVDTVYGNDSTQVITLYWGNTQATDSSNGAEVFDTSNGFIGVWHMNEDPSAGTASIKDRTINAHGATPFGSMTTANSVDGAVGKALSFDGINDYLNAGNVSVPGNYSVGLWVRPDTLGGYERYIYKDSSYTLWYDKDSVSVRMEHFNPATWWRGLLQDGGKRVPLTVGTWSHLIATFDGAVIRLYKDGKEESGSNTITVFPRTNSKPLQFGLSLNNSYAKCAMDEIRIEGVARSADWIKLCYMNQRPNNLLVNFR